MTLEQLARRVQDALDALEASPGFTEATPPTAEALAWVREVYTDHRGPLRPRAKLAPGASYEARALAGMLRWHRSGGNLEGMMIARMVAGPKADEIDTLATTLIVLTGQRSTALAAWERTGIL